MDSNGGIVMKTTSIFAALCMTGLVACGSGPDTAEGDVTLSLQRLQDGNLEYCDADGECYTLPYDGDCAVIEIEINTATGTSCERCIMPDGSVIDNGCSDVTVGCTVVTIPDPDCVVCAYYNGAVIFSTCIAEEPQCTSDDDCRSSDDARPGYCLDGQCVYEPGCTGNGDCPPGFVCEMWNDTANQLGTCVPRPMGCEGDADCPSGMQCLLICTDNDCPDGSTDCPPPYCEGVCVEDRPSCDDISCRQGEHCEMRDTPCFAEPCSPVPVCVPDAIDCDTSHALCLMMQPMCAPGLVISVIGSCYGPCVEPGLCAPMRCDHENWCPAGFVCEAVDCTPGMDCIGGGMCVPEPLQPSCDEIECPIGEHCELQDVWCFTTPCPPMPVCVPNGVDCDTRHVLCEMMPPVCPPGLVNSVNGACYGPCVEPEACEPIYCADDYACPYGFACELTGVGPDDWDGLYAGVCVPRPPVPPTCDDIECPEGEHCEMEPVWCITEPCLPVLACVPDKVDCDLSHAICDLIPPICPEGLVLSVIGACYGPCVEPEACEPRECIVSGCSGQVCAEEEIMTTCEWLPEYACFADAACERQDNGYCGWTMTDELAGCLREND